MLDLRGVFHCPFGPSQLRRLGPNGPRNTAIMGALPRGGARFQRCCRFAASDMVLGGEVRRNVFPVIVAGRNAAIFRGRQQAVSSAWGGERPRHGRDTGQDTVGVDGEDGKMSRLVGMAGIRVGEVDCLRFRLRSGWKPLLLWLSGGGWCFVAAAFLFEDA